MDSEKIEYVEGPVELTEIKIPKLKKHYYIFGDEHVHKKICPSEKIKTTRIDNFIETIILNNSTKIIDLFLELDFPDIITDVGNRDIKYQVINENNKITYQSTPDYLTDIFHKFYTCFEKKKGKCIYPNLRAHYTDIRYIGLNYYLMQFIKNVDDTYKQIQLANIMFKNKINNMTDIILNISKDGIKMVNLLPLKIDDIYKMTKIDKQLKYIDFQIRDIFYKHFDIKLINSLNEAGSLLEKINKESSFDDIIVAINKLFDYLSISFDAYVCARSLRKFKDSEINNIIIYVGSHHAKNIVDFLLKLESSEKIFENFSNKPNLDYQCLDIRKLDKKFFNIFLNF